MKFFPKKQPGTQHRSINTDAIKTEVLDDAQQAEGELTAVIALAIHKYVTEVREYENTVLTIQQVIKPYSPWSSKIYGLRQQPLYVPGLRMKIK
ncbi:hypothetical protein OCK74_24650 [Chitinophagaceae bacterium LB-8]|uniref:Uncharacterized protein n=1 Tax=Paraflavisolibacter caeni TaxID=2982496 RepID=A0A9X2Y298_9BACT|nr:hypothetical protein [Paraflavisolibacter caeni]MCU7552333.1 hypothetical protein [Paraflavisolibacter caeni]